MNGQHLQLVQRNAQLETELRFVKQQLSQANEATQYLLGLLASRPAPAPKVEILPSAGTAELGCKSAPKADLARTVEVGSQPAPPKHEDLLSFGDENLAERTTSSLKTGGSDQVASDLRALVHSAAARHVGDQGDGACDVLTGHAIGINGVPSASERNGTEHTAVRDVDRQHHPRDGPRTPGRRLSPHLANPPRQPALPTSSARNSPWTFHQSNPRPLTVFPSDHARLKNIACFVEAMSEEEQTLHWRKFANNFPSHTPSEWQEYYDIEIRPGYLQSCERSSVEDSAVEQSEEEVVVAAQEDASSSLKRSDSFVEKGDSQPESDAQHESGAQNESDAQPESDTEPAARKPEDATSDAPAIVVSEIPVQGSDAGGQYHATSCRATDDSVQSLFCANAVNDPCQTAIVRDIVPRTPLTDVLQHLTAGKVISAIYLETAMMRLKSEPMGTDTVLVRFADGPRARRFVAACEGTIRITSSRTGEAVEATLDLVQTPARPFRPRLGLGSTRVISVHDASGQLHLNGILEYLLQPCFNIRRPLRSFADNQGILHLEFRSIAHAEAAWMVMNVQHSPMFQYVQKKFEIDPCDE